MQLFWMFLIATTFVKGMELNDKNQHNQLELSLIDQNQNDEKQNNSNILLNSLLNEPRKNSIIDFNNVNDQNLANHTKNKSYVQQLEDIFDDVLSEKSINLNDDDKLQSNSSEKSNNLNDFNEEFKDIYSLNDVSEDLANLLDCGGICEEPRIPAKNWCKKCLSKRALLNLEGWSKDLSDALPDVLTTILDFVYNFYTPSIEIHGEYTTCTSTYSGRDWNQMSANFLCTYYMYVVESRATEFALMIGALFYRPIYDAYARKMIERIYASKKCMVTDFQKQFLYDSAALFDGKGWLYNTDPKTYTGRFMFVFRAVVVDTLVSYTVLSFFNAAFSPAHTYVYLVPNSLRDINDVINATECNFPNAKHNKKRKDWGKLYEDLVYYAFIHINWPSKFGVDGFDLFHCTKQGGYGAYLPVDRTPCKFRDFFCKKMFRMLASTMAIILDLVTFSLVQTQFLTMYYDNGKVMTAALILHILYTIAKSESRPVVAQWWFQTLLGISFWFYKVNIQLLPNLLTQGMFFKGIWNMFVRGPFVINAGSVCSFPFFYNDEGYKDYSSRFVEPGETNCYRIVRAVANLEYPFTVDLVWAVAYGFFFSLGMSSVAGLFDEKSWVYKLLPKLGGPGPLKLTKKYNEFFMIAAGFMYWILFQALSEGYYLNYFPGHVTLFGIFYMIAQAITVLDKFVQFIWSYLQNW